MVVFDASILLALLSANIPAPRNPATNDPVDSFRERIDYLVKQLEADRTKIVIPTPALSEILVRSGSAGPDYLSHINSASVFRVLPFDQRAAVEVASMTRDAIGQGDKRGGSDATWAKVKYDRQIVAIAKVEGASVIYSDDGGVHRIGVAAGLTVLRTAGLPLPSEDTQRKLEFEGGRPDVEEAEQEDNG